MGIIQLNQVSVTRGRSKVLENWSLSVDSGEVVCLFGDNGCGKSTVIEASSGLIPLDSGSVQINNKLIRDSEGRRGRSDFGLCLQNDCVMGDEIVGERILDAAGKNFDPTPLLKKWGLDHRINDRVASLSGGQRRKLAVLSGIIPALVSSEKKAILLDEPDSGLDENSVKLLSETLRNLAAGGHSVLIASHNPEIVKNADKVVRFPFELTENECKKGVYSKIESTSDRNSLIGHRLNVRTLAGLANNAIVGLIILGSMLALLQPGDLEGRLQTAFILAPALGAGMCGNPIHNLTLENRAFAWWKTRSAIPPNAIFHSLVICGSLTALASTITGEVDIRLVLVGAIFGALTELIVGMLNHSTLNLSRPNSVMIRLLTPILILPWALVVDTLSA